MFLPRLVLQLSDCLGPIPLKTPIYKLIVASAHHAVLRGHKPHTDPCARIQWLLRRAKHNPMRHENERSVNIRSAFLSSHQCRWDHMNSDGGTFAVVRREKPSLLIIHGVPAKFCDYSRASQRPRCGGQRLRLHVPLPHHQKQLSARSHHLLLRNVECNQLVFTLGLLGGLVGQLLVLLEHHLPALLAANTTSSLLVSVEIALSS
mmetsp:Transcript_51383/g.135521  ORF Transcript_51383/g.135521 Transcript_51383/m.135521 type:complete len:205 (+) Transcript_51383:1177-1791(+)